MNAGFTAVNKIHKAYFVYMKKLKKLNGHLLIELIDFLSRLNNGIFYTTTQLDRIQKLYEKKTLDQTSLPFFGPK